MIYNDTNVSFCLLALSLSGHSDEALILSLMERYMMGKHLDQMILLKYIIKSGEKKWNKVEISQKFFQAVTFCF